MHGFIAEFERGAVEHFACGEGGLCGAVGAGGFDGIECGVAGTSGADFDDVLGFDFHAVVEGVAERDAGGVAGHDVERGEDAAVGGDDFKACGLCFDFAEDEGVEFLALCIESARAEDGVDDFCGIRIGGFGGAFKKIAAGE